MTNSFYNVTGAPAQSSFGSSAVIRAEYAAVAAGFDKMPALTANKAVVVNSGGTALTVTEGSLSLAGNFTTTGAFNTTLAQQASVTLTLPAANSQLATLALAETFTNKTITSPSIGGTVSGGATYNSPILVTPQLGTPASGNLANCTGFPASGLGGLGAGVATWLATPSSANLAAAVTGETGSGALVFGTSPIITTPAISGAMTYGGVTLAANVTGTGNMVLSIGPTLTGTLTAAAANFSGAMTGTSATFSGVFTSNSTSLGFVASAAAGVGRGMAIQTSGSNRWSVVANSTAESGGNAGSNFGINRFNDAGTLVDTPIFINRASGLISLTDTNITDTLGIGDTGNRLLITSGGGGAVINQNDNSSIIFQSQGVTLLTITPSGQAVVASASSAAMAVGPNGLTNPAFQVNAAAGSLASGLAVVGNVAAGPASLQAISSAADASIRIDAKGAGTITLGAVSTGGITLSRLATLSAGMNVTGDVGVTGDVTLNGSFAANGPFRTANVVTQTGNFTWGANDTSVIVNNGATTTATLPGISVGTVGRWLFIKTIQAQAVNSASSNVTPRVGGAAGTAILPATDGAWALLQCDGSTWIIMASGV